MRHNLWTVGHAIFKLGGYVAPEKYRLFKTCTVPVHKVSIFLCAVLAYNFEMEGHRKFIFGVQVLTGLVLPYLGQEVKVQGHQASKRSDVKCAITHVTFVMRSSDLLDMLFQQNTT